jgi:peptidoglycan hydrolase CwlO-like protein
MGRVIATTIVVAAIAGAIFFYTVRNERAIQDAQQKQIAELMRQAEALRSENEELKTSLAKVQEEENSLVAQNQELSKAIAQYKATGKMPSVKLPYPPK